LTPASWSDVSGRIRNARVAWVLTALSIFLVLAWARQIQAGYLVAATLTTVLAAVAARRERTSPFVLAALAAVALALLAGLDAGRRFRAIEYDWARIVQARDADLTRQLERRMESAIERARTAVELSAEAALRAPPGRVLFEELEQLRGRTGVDAIALFTHGGDLLSWAGDHRGSLPEAVRRAQSGMRLAERPLYSYLYLSHPVAGNRQHVVAAMLIETGLVQDRSSSSFTGAFEERTGARPVFRAGAGVAPDWVLVEGTDTIAHGTFERMTQAQARENVERGVQRIAALAGLLAFALLAIGMAQAQPTARWPSALPLLLAVPALLLAPIGPAFETSVLFSPLYFLLPGIDATLGSVLLLLLPLASLAATVRLPVPGRDRRLLLVTGAAAVAVGYMAGLRLVLDAAAQQLMTTSGALWFGLQIALVLLLTMLTALAMPQRAPLTVPRIRAWGGARVEVGLAALGLSLSVALAVLLHLRLRPLEGAQFWTAGLWFAPFLLLGTALAGLGGNTGRLLRWTAAGWLAATAVIPHVWVAHVGARLDDAEREVGTLGAQPDPYLDYLLVDLGREAQRRYAAGEEGIQLLYRAWVASGMARESYPVQAALWDAGGQPQLQLNLGDAMTPDTLPAMLGRIARARQDESEPHLETVVDDPTVSRLLTVPLAGDGVITFTVPPRRSLERTSVIAPFLGAVQNQDTRLNLIPARPGRDLGEGTLWVESETGWRSDTLVRFPDGPYHAHLEVQLPSLGVRLARGMLVLVLDLGLLVVLWYVGCAARGAAPKPRHGWLRWMGSFRARITVALFGFFLLPTAVFGWATYSALAGEVARATRAVAQRAAAVAVLEFPDVDGNLRELAEHAGSDVLYYFRGELADVSSPEALALGVYGAWMPPTVYLSLEGGDDLAAVETRAIGDRPFLTAYHSLPATGTLAVPMALAAGDTAVRQRELAHLVLFAALVGALLSLALSVLVGRALAGPIGQLRRASAAVGAGRLRVRLPQPPSGEFGQLFASFNRMVRRLRRARTQELRTARVLAWGEMARQIAHEIKNPLTPIKLSVQHLRRAYRDRRADFGDILDDSVTQILNEIDRLTEIARAFSRYGAPGADAGPVERVDATAVVRDALTLYRSSDTAIEFRSAIEAALPPVRARPGELKEVILNLLENARDALEGRGIVEVQLYRVGEAVALDVVDDGPGIPEMLQERIFDPHFSTRSSGTGLGLAIVRRIVESWGGTITVESTPGEGTVMHVRMRAADDGRPPLRLHGRDKPAE